MRYFILDNYNTWYDWRLTLTAKDVTAPEPKTHYVSIDGMSGSLDLSEALTGHALYNDRTVTASFRSSEGTFQERRDLLRNIRAALHGKKVQIIEPDDPNHYFYGRIKIKDVVQDQVHIAFTIEAICDPWRYAIEETDRKTVAPSSLVIENKGAKTHVSKVTVFLFLVNNVTLAYNGKTVTMTSGTWEFPDLWLEPGINVFELTASGPGRGFVTFTYREAVL